MGTEEQQALITQPTGPMPGSAPWSKGLGSLLLREDEDGRSDARAAAIRLIALNPTLRAETERLLPVLREMKQPASRDEIIVIVAREMPAWGVSTKHAGEFGVTYASYADALEGLSAYAIEEGIVRWNRGEGHKDLAMGGFPPRPAQLSLLANEAKRELWMAAYRAEKAIAHVEKTGTEWTAERKKAEKQKMIDLGYLKPDGTPNMVLKGREMPMAPKPTRSPQQVAEELRAHAQARHSGAPISRSHTVAADPGDVV